MERIYKIDIDSLIGLCFIIDEYEEFCTDLRELVERNKNVRYIAEAFNNFLNGSKGLMERRLKRVFDKYYNQLFNINNHIAICDFFFKNFTDLGIPQDNSKAFHDYLRVNRDQAFKILDLLFSINKLGITEVELAEGTYFENNIYDVSRDYFRNKSIYYLDNMKPIPAYTENEVRYTTSSSNYEIKVKPVFDKNNAIATKIRVNSLTFDNSRLPSKINKEVVFDDLMNKSHKYEAINQAIRESVDLNIGLMNIEKANHELMNAANSIPTLCNRKELIEALQRIRSGLDTLQKISSDYDNIVISSNDEVDAELLANEKMATLAKRNNTK